MCLRLRREGNLSREETVALIDALQRVVKDLESGREIAAPPPLAAGNDSVGAKVAAASSSSAPIPSIIANVLNPRPEFSRRVSSQL